MFAQWLFLVKIETFKLPSKLFFSCLPAHTHISVPDKRSIKEQQSIKYICHWPLKGQKNPVEITQINDRAVRCPSSEMDSQNLAHLPKTDDTNKKPHVPVWQITIWEKTHEAEPETPLSIWLCVTLRKKCYFLFHVARLGARWSGSDVDDISRRCIQAPTCTKSGIKLISRLCFNRGLCNKANTPL